MNSVFRFLLWISVIAWSLWFCGLVYEVVVITPLWSGSMPQSVMEWNSRPQYAVIPTKFFAPVAIAAVLSSLLCLIFGWRAVNRRKLLVISFASAATALSFTVIYFLPKNDVLFYQRGANLSGDEITALATAWLNANWIRMAIMAVGYVAALRVFSSPDSDQ